MPYIRTDSSLLVDLYELTMAQSYFNHRVKAQATFDLFARDLPKNRSYFIFAGLEDVLRFLTNLKFSQEDLDYLERLGFSEDFLTYLESSGFTARCGQCRRARYFFPMNLLSG